MESLPDSEIKDKYEKEILRKKGESNNNNNLSQYLPENEFDGIVENKAGSGVLTLESLLSSIQDTEGFSAVKTQLKDMAIANAIDEKGVHKKTKNNDKLLNIGSTSKNSKSLKPSVTKTPAPVYARHCKHTHEANALSGRN